LNFNFGPRSLLLLVPSVPAEIFLILDSRGSLTSHISCFSVKVLCLLFTDAFQAHQKLPLVSDSEELQKILEDVGAAKTAEGVVDNVDGSYVVGAGLQNEVGEYNCFLNVIIQVCADSSFIIILSVVISA